MSELQKLQAQLDRLTNGGGYHPQFSKLVSEKVKASFSILGITKIQFDQVNGKPSLLGKLYDLIPFASFVDPVPAVAVIHGDESTRLYGGEYSVLGLSFATIELDETGEVKVALNSGAFMHSVEALASMLEKLLAQIKDEMKKEMGQRAHSEAAAASWDALESSQR